MPSTTAVLIHIDHGEGQDKEVLTFDYEKLLLAEAVALEDETGWSMGQLLGYAGIGSYKAARAMIWILRKRANPKTKISDINYALEQIFIEDPDQRDEDESELPEAPKADSGATTDDS